MCQPNPHFDTRHSYRGTVEPEHADLGYIGVRDLVARGYVIPGGASQRGGGQAPAFRVARYLTRSLVDVRVGPVGSRQGSWGLVGDPYGSVS